MWGAKTHQQFLAEPEWTDIPYPPWQTRSWDTWVDERRHVTGTSSRYCPYHHPTMTQHSWGIVRAKQKKGQETSQGKMELSKRKLALVRTRTALQEKTRMAFARRGRSSPTNNFSRPVKPCFFPNRSVYNAILKTSKICLHLFCLMLDSAGNSVHSKSKQSGGPIAHSSSTCSQFVGSSVPKTGPSPIWSLNWFDWECDQPKSQKIKYLYTCIQ